MTEERLDTLTEASKQIDLLINGFSYLECVCIIGNSLTGVYCSISREFPNYPYKEELEWFKNTVIERVTAMLERANDAGN